MRLASIQMKSIHSSLSSGLGLISHSLENDTILLFFFYTQKRRFQNLSGMPGGPSS